MFGNASDPLHLLVACLLVVVGAVLLVIGGLWAEKRRHDRREEP